MLSNAEALEAELQSIEAIFPDVFNILSSKKISLRFEDKIRLDILFPDDYPELSPPSYELSCPSLPRQQRLALENTLQERYAENIGEPVLYVWIEAVQSFLTGGFPSEEDDDLDSSLETCDSEVDTPESGMQVVPSIFSSEPVTDRKSSFQAHIARVNSAQEASLVLKRLKENSKIARATHNIVAYRIWAKKNDSYFQISDCDDDGETGASSKMLGILERMHANNVIVIVSRWYGGIHLGPDRFRIINNLTREIVLDHPQVYDRS